jgi:hypothetical protein
MDDQEKIRIRSNILYGLSISTQKLILEKKKSHLFLVFGIDNKVIKINAQDL